MNFSEIFRDIFPLGVGTKHEGITWEYEQVREYLISLSSGPQNLISINDYPQVIKLSRHWHEILDKMRRASQDGLERLSFIGARDDKLTVQEDFIIGEPHRIPSKLVSEAIRRGRRGTETEFIGTIHSHPRKRLERDILWGLWKERIHHVAGFSPKDLYPFTVSFSSYRFYPEYLAMVVEGNGVVLSLRTQETETAQINPELVSQVAFDSYWRQKEKNDIHLNSDLEIAKRHNLVFYRANIGECLSRIPLTHN